MMLRRMGDVGVFLDRAGRFLREQEAEHNLMLGICSNLRANPRAYGDDSPYFFVIEDAVEGGKVVAASLRTPPFNLILSESEKPEAISLVAAELFRRGESLPGVIGPKLLALAFARCWSALTERLFRIATEMRIYKLTETSSSIPPPVGQSRRATAADRETLLRWFGQFHSEAMGDENPDQTARSVERYLSADPQAGGIFLWEVEGAPVSMANYSGPTGTGIRVTGVYTPPEHRREGYASACVAVLSQRLLDMGYEFCFLFTDLSNPTSNHIYGQIGYQPVTDVDEYRFS